MSMQDLTHSDTVSGSPSLDVAVATRFISSLSKSLQALCHGCMDFDTGIEIVGFINVNIDNGNKADYVLNEKVSKCANNSMTFVSNSFLAKKEQPKQTRDGACSPVQELMIPVHSSSHNNGYQHPHHRNAHPYLSHSQAPSPHKRPWSGTERLRGSPRKQSRGGRLTDNPVHHHSAGIVGFGSPAFTASSSTKIMQNPQSETPLGSSQEPGSKVDNKGVGVKKEAFESEYLDEASATSSGVDSKLNFDIKPDPESVPNQDEYASGGNFSDNFLNDQSDPYSQPQQVSEQSEDASDTNIPMTSSIANSHSHPDSNTHHTNTGIPLEFDNSASNSAYLRQGHNPQSSSDQEAGATMEESGLDVIEIGDEDEDLQTVFGHNHMMPQNSVAGWSSQNTFETSESFINTNTNHLSSCGLMDQGFQDCQFCPERSMNYTTLKTHISRCHGDTLPFSCTVCGYGYVQHQSLKRHMVTHNNKFSCPVCDAKFTQKSSIKSHLMAKHKSSQCPSCLMVFAVGESFNKHILSCT